MEKLMLYFAAHFIGDYSLQADWMFHGKKTSWGINFAHAAVYASVFIIFANVSVLAGLVIFASHFLIDPLKARWGIIKSVFVDQLLHFAVIFVVLWLGL